MNEFEEYLDQYRTTSVTLFTHALINFSGNPYSRFSNKTYNIPFSDREKFYELLCQYILNNEKLICITEKPTLNSPLRLDIDLIYRDKDGINSLKTDIKMIIDVYNKIINYYFIVEPINLLAYVLEKEKPSISNSNKINDGIHIIYPNLVLSRKYQKMINKLANRQLNSLDDIMIDHNIINTTWMLYGCCKPNNYPYKLTHVYDSNLDDIINQVNTDIIHLNNLLSVNLPSNVTCINLKPNLHQQCRIYIK